MKKVLILGGTQFIGRVIVEQLLGQNKYDVYLFNRGKTGPDLFPNAQHIKGDRETEELSQIQNYQWHAVIDCSAYTPLNLDKTISYLKSNTRRYIFISTVSVFDFDKITECPISETSPKLTASEKDIQEDDWMKFYGEYKAVMEQTILATKEFDSIILRPSFVYGKYDPYDRTYFWIHNLKKAVPFLLPKNRTMVMNHTYVEDLAKITLESIDIEKHNSDYIIATHQSITFEDYLNSLRKVLDSNTEYIEMSPKQLEEFELKAFKDFPLWHPELTFSFSLEKTIQDFETVYTPFEKSIQETIDYYDKLGWPKPKRGISRTDQQEIIGKMEHGFKTD